MKVAFRPTWRTVILALAWVIALGFSVWSMAHGFGR